MFKVIRTSRRDEGDLVADFDVEVAGITLTGCGLRRRGADYIALAPRGFSRPGTRTVWFSQEARDALDDAGQRVASDLGLVDDEDDAAGLRRAIGETMERAGL